MTTKPIKTSTLQVLQTLAWINKLGFRGVPLHPQSKAAVNRDYTDKKYQTPQDMWKQGDFGIGIVTGPQCGGPVDIDLDCEEAIFFAPRFLPPTDAIFGRSSKKRSHFLYKVDSPSFDKQAFLDPCLTKSNTIIEMRGDNGHQTVMPGSLHQDTGELIEWSGVPFPEVTTVVATDLRRSVSKIAIATLLVRHVWAAGYHNEPAKHLAGLFFYLDWTCDETCDLISAVMEFTDDTDKSRLPTVRATFKRGEAGKKISGAGVLRKQLKNDTLVDRLLELAGSPTINLLQQYNDRFAVVSIEGKFRIADTEVPPGEPPVFFLKDDFQNLMATDFSGVVNPTTGAPVPKHKLWLANPRRRQYRNVDFLPGVEDGNVLNLWTGWTEKPSELGSCKAWLELLHDVICGGDQELNDWMLHWFANIVREPMHKSLTAPVLIGPEGAGKSLLIGYFGRILGPGYVTVTNEEHVYGRFNKHIASTLLLHSEEALYGGEKKHAGIIRSLITDEFRIYEQKGVDARRVRNFLRLVLTSNELHAAPAKPGDRRYTVINMADRKASERLIAAVLAELDDGGPAALHHHLVTMQYDPKIPRINVKNDALIGMKRINMTPIESWWFDALTRGTVLPDYLAWATQPERDDWPTVVSSIALQAAMSIHIHDHGGRGVPNSTLFALQLNKFVGIQLHRSQRRFDDPLPDNIPMPARNLGERHSSVVDMPSLNDCRMAFEKHLGQTIDWPVDDDKPTTRKGDAF